jgi:hypothetical protein
MSCGEIMDLNLRADSERHDRGFDLGRSVNFCSAAPPKTSKQLADPKQYKDLRAVGTMWEIYLLRTNED